MGDGAVCSPAASVTTRHSASRTEFEARFMPIITYIEASGRRHDVDVPAGHTLMEGARDNDVPGLLADCGGSCSCGTCKVIVAELWRDRLSAMSELEGGTLEMYEEPGAGERLSCQIVVSDEMAGLVVTMPEKQI